MSLKGIRSVINGTVITGGSSVVIRNGKVIVDGEDVTPGDAKEITIQIEGDVDRLEVDACNTISVTGNAGSVTTSQGDVNVGSNVDGMVKTSQGNIEVVGDVAGDAKTSQGNIRVRGTLGGNARTTMGDIRHG